MPGSQEPSPEAMEAARRHLGFDIDADEMRRRVEIASVGYKPARRAELREVETLARALDSFRALAAPRDAVLADIEDEALAAIEALPRYRYDPEKRDLVRDENAALLIACDVRGVLHNAVCRRTRALPPPSSSCEPRAGGVEVERASKDRAYTERNRLVAFLSRLYPSSLERHPASDASWEDDWRWIVFVDLPTGQATWHIHDSHLPLFAHLARETGRKWDGHTTDEKYDRLSRLPSRDGGGAKGGAK